MNGVRGWFQIFRLNPDGRSDMSSSNETNNTRVCALPNNLPVCSVEEQVRGIREGNIDKSLAIKVDNHTQSLSFMEMKSWPERMLARRKLLQSLLLDGLKTFP